MRHRCVVNDTAEGQNVQAGFVFDEEQAEAAKSPERSGQPASTADADAGPSPYLELEGNSVEEPKEHSPGGELAQSEQIYECRAVGCRSRFCKCCCRKLGNKLRRELTPALAKFTAITMLTLTIDPKLFDSPESAYWYVRDQRAIAHLVYELLRMGQLKSKRFFYVVEWHKNGWPHFHVLVESSFIEFKLLAKAWGKNRPTTAPKWEGDYGKSLKGVEPEFGTVHITNRASDFKSADHAANYALKYVTKQPENGFPDWVLDSKRQIRIYQSSRSFLRETKPKETSSDSSRSTAPTRHAADCFCDACRHDDTPTIRRRVASQRTIRDRIAHCGEDAAILRYKMESDGQGGLKQGPRTFVRPLAISFAKALELLGCSEIKERAVNLRPGELLTLTTRRFSLSVVGGGSNPNDVMRHTSFDAWNDLRVGI